VSFFVYQQKLRNTSPVISITAITVTKITSPVQPINSGNRFYRFTNTSKLA